MTLERKIVDLKVGRRYCVVGPRMAVDFHVSDLDSANPTAGLECHYKQQPGYFSGHEPFDEHCWLTGSRCWGDGTTLYAEEWLLPLFRELPLDGFWRVLEEEHNRRDLHAFGEQEAS